MNDILAIGEILIDLTQSGVTEQGIPRFDANPGESGSGGLAPWGKNRLHRPYQR